MGRVSSPEDQAELLDDLDRLLRSTHGDAKASARRGDGGTTPGIGFDGGPAQGAGKSTTAAAPSIAELTARHSI
jgi:hypothetical protein